MSQDSAVWLTEETAPAEQHYHVNRIFEESNILESEFNKPVVMKL